MVRRIILFVLVGVLVYVGYTKYMEYSAQVNVRRSSDVDEDQEVVEEEDETKQSPAERALRRRQKTERQSTNAEKSVGKSDKHP